MSAILRITFLAPAEVDDTLVFDYHNFFPDTGTEFTVAMVFKTTRTALGESLIGGNAAAQAQLYVKAFTADYLHPDFLISRDANIVTITCLNGSEIFDEAINVGGTFAEFESVAADSDNMIHEIIFTPRQYATPSGLARNYLVTEEGDFILTENNKKIRV
jgi:hypothetical protein